MSLIIAGRFTTFPAAERAAQTLLHGGFLQEHVTLFFVNPPGQHARFAIGGNHYADAGARSTSKGAGKGVVVGAVIGAVIGAAIFMAFRLPAFVSIIAVGIGAYVGSLIGAMSHTRRERGKSRSKVPASQASRHAGVLVAVQVEPESQAEAARVLLEAGGVEIERAHGHWQDGKWIDFDPLKAPDLAKDLIEKFQKGRHA